MAAGGPGGAADAEKARLARRALSTRVDEDGMVVLRARLTPEVGAVVLRALEAALEQVPAGAEGEEAGIAQRRADALGLVAESALAGGLDPGRPGDRFQVTVHVEAETLRSSEPINATADTSAETHTIRPVSPEPAAPTANAAIADLFAASRATRPTVPEPAHPAANAATVDTSAETQAAREAASGPAAPADAVAGQTHVDTADVHHHAAAGSGLDAGQAVIEQAGGIHLGKDAARRIGCDSGGLVLIHAPDGGVLDVGRRTRTVPTAMRRALEGRDRNGCQFPGCNSRHCDAHHVVHWADGGASELSNLILVCRFHHRALHEEGFQVVANGAGGFQFLRPDGAPLPAVPPAPRWKGGGDPLAPTVARLAGAGIGIGPHTATPEWYGESLNVTAALDALWELPVGEPPATVTRAGVP